MIKGKADINCTGCMLCSEVCPQNCITKNVDNLGFVYPEVNTQYCIDCNNCENNCPKENPSYVNQTLKSYCAYSKKASIRIHSSSGGVFFEIAQCFINEGGIVYGAAFSKNFRNVEHIRVETMQDLHKIMGSKYVQSEIDTTFLEISNDILSGRKALFVGTPCQVAAIKQYVGNKELLYTIDLICHGVASPSIWQKYLDSIHKNKKIASVFMRDKKHGWNNFSMMIKYENGKTYRKTLSFDLFLRGFLENLFLRTSCYSCPFRSKDRLGDITLADFWGANIETKNGISLVGIQTEKGNRLFNSCINDLEVAEVDWEKSISTNSAAMDEIDKPLQRNRFEELLNRDITFGKAIRSCLNRRTLKTTIFYIVRLFVK